MILVDTTVWIDLFNDKKNQETEKLEAAVADKRDIATCGIVMTEILQGISDEKEFTSVKSILEGLIYLPLHKGTYVAAANLYRKLRAKGITVRNTVDCVIGALCIEHGVELLHTDKDFDHIARYTDLKIM